MTVRRYANISADGVYRYYLLRLWDGDDYGDKCTFIMLNPSTADHMVDDPTIRRCVGFAEREGCTGLEVVNLFASIEEINRGKCVVRCANCHSVKTWREKQTAA